jgi:hypothetical protein
MKSKPFKDLSTRGKAWASGVIGVSLAIVAAAQRDLQHRAPSEIKGNKLLWRLICLNALGALCYFGWGRRAIPA